MRLAVAMLVLSAGAAAAAPVPREPMPDPLGRGYLGIVFGDAPLTIGRVEPGTPAARAGLQPGDEFVRVGPVEPRERTEMQILLAGLRPGSRVLITVRRRGETKTVVVQLAARSADIGPPVQLQPTEPP